MKYTFSKNTQNHAVASFEGQDQLIAYWLMGNFSTANKDLERLIHFSKKLEALDIDDFQSSQGGYYLQLNQESAKLTALSTLKNPLEQQDKIDGKMDFDNMSECNIPLATFNQMLQAWSHHIQN